ncbi:MAG: LCP family protein [Clostridia bacterium]|nr:LCP family protein [Clostridia bacterium]
MGKNDELNFDFNEFDEFEDIASNSSRAKAENAINFSSVGNKHYARKKHGFKGWWGNLSRGKKALSIILSVVVLLTALVVVNPFHMIEHLIYNYNNMTENQDELGFEGKIDKNVINVALFGIDTRNKNTFKGNSDSIMILSLNTELKTVKIISILRDTIVPIEENGKIKYGKINSAYAKGPEVAIKTLNTVFNLDISEYATVNFYGMTEIIDAVGGIDVTVVEDELKWKGHDHPNLNNCMDEICKNLKLDPKKYYINAPGKYHMNGVQAVAYSRVRNCKSVWGTNNDYGRTDRQRHVMEQLFNKAVKLDKSRYPKLAKALIPCTETSLSYTQVLNLAFNVLLDKPTFYQTRFPQDDWLMAFRWKGYGSVVYYDLDYASRVLHSIIYENKTLEQYVEENGVEHNDWFAKREKTAKSSSVSSSASQKSGSTVSTGSSQAPQQNNQTAGSSSAQVNSGANLTSQTTPPATVIDDNKEEQRPEEEKSAEEKPVDEKPAEENNGENNE